MEYPHQKLTPPENALTKTDDKVFENEINGQGDMCLNSSYIPGEIERHMSSEK